jgi:two-component sensor histidine kinase
MSPLATCASAIALANRRAGVRLAVDRAIPLALLTTELVTNATKYAYSGAEKGPVRVQLASENGHVALDHRRPRLGSAIVL